MSDQLSSAALKKLGRRIRMQVTPEDLDLLDHYRRRFDPALVEMNGKLVDGIKATSVDALVSGRIKRTKSIVRKLVREPSMDLSRMADIVGLRIIVRTLKDQEELVGMVASQVERPRVIDRTKERTAYRAIHVTGVHGGLPIEIQLRSIPQQLWANESESLGEQVKEGGGTDEDRGYLEELSAAIFDFEKGVPGVCDQIKHRIAAARQPFAYRMPWIERKFNTAIGVIEENEVRSELLIYDGRTAEIIKAISFRASERSDAVAEFEHLSRTLDPVRFDVLVLNSTSHAALCVTHPRFYL